MYRREFLSAGLATAGIVAMGTTPWAPALAAGDEGHRLTGPYTHRNLSIYLIHRPIHRRGRDAGTPPLTLDEAMRTGAIRVVETGNVGELIVNNPGDRDIFIQAGDIVKGGKQDRVLTASMIVPPNSGDIPIGAFCVEQGRWGLRGSENVAKFSASTALIPSRTVKFAIMAQADRPQSGRGSPPAASRSLMVRRSRASGRQESVWRSVRTMQRRLSSSVNRQVADRRSRSSLQLSLESEDLATALAGFGTSLGDLPTRHPDAVGFVFAVNGRINSGDEFESAGLFRKLWRRQLRAAATEALAATAQMERTPPTPPTSAEVAAFFGRAGAAAAVSKAMPGNMVLITRETATSLYTEARRGDGSWVHRRMISVE
ncbi:MAG: hypothetical protein F4114_10445 [Rhodospirillaceae bacterium]|nr:hypothetical protein [Rhodospirillaceae bacterium]MYB12751.1 hypothetical protein [Rhodospirillaceae bacterium]MYI49490.1 hypothetical protein [Rhodospirillaceae bacterium]